MLIVTTCFLLHMARQFSVGPRQGVNTTTRRGNPLPNSTTRAPQQGSNTHQDLSKEVSEMRSMLNKLLLKQTQVQQLGPSSYDGA